MLRNDDGRHNAVVPPLSLAPGGELRLAPGYVTSEGVEVSDGVRCWMTSVRRKRSSGVATVEVERPTTAAVTVEPEEPNLLARLLRAPNEAHLRSLTATPVDHDAVQRIPVRQACGHYVDWYRKR